MLHDYEPETIPAQAEYIQLLATFDDFVEARRERIDAVTLELPPLFWLVIWVGAAVNAVLIAFIQVKSLRLHLMVAGLLALFVGLVMFVTADMDHPYQGSISVGPGAFERVIEQIIVRLDPEYTPQAQRVSDRFMRRLLPPGAERRSKLGGQIPPTQECLSMYIPNRSVISSDLEISRRIHLRLAGCARCRTPQRLPAARLRPRAVRSAAHAARRTRARPY